MRYWIPYAFIRIVVFFIAGIVLALYGPGIPLPWTGAILCLVVLLYLVLFFLKRRFRSLRINPGFVGLIAILIGGYVNVQVSTETKYDAHIIHVDSVRAYHGVMITPAQEKTNSWKQVISISKVKTNEGWKDASGKVVLYFSKKSYDKPFRYGDVLIVRGKPDLIPSPANPGEFDQRKFLSYHNIFHQQFVRDNGALFISNAPPSRIMDWSISARQWADDAISRFVKGEREIAVASALVLGITDGLDHEIMSAYSTTGVMHILSVSGLHVGIVYMIVALLLGPLKRIKHGTWAIALIGIIILWIYACITGLSPSVLRAVTMFSFVALAKPFNHRTNIYNTLAASAFCLLLFDPFLIMSVGFQLSYLAVVGIVYLQPMLYNLVEPDSRLLDEIWKVCAVSIAAQLTTLALCLYYFHQFPNYFLLSNLFVIPIAFGVLVVGIGVIATSFIAPLAHLLGTLLSWLITLMNYLILKVDALPYAVVSNINISLFQCVMLMALLVFVVLLFQYRKVYFVYLATLSVILFSADGWIHYSKKMDQARLTVYRISGNSGMDLIHNGTAYYFFNDSIDVTKVNFHVSPNRIREGAEILKDGTLEPFTRMIDGVRLTLWKDKTIMQMTAMPEVIPTALTVDYLILSNNLARRLPEIRQKINAKSIILDSSNSYFVADKAISSLPKHDHVHSVWHHGAFDITL